MLIEKKHSGAQCLTGKNYDLLLVLAVVQRKVGYWYTGMCKHLTHRFALFTVNFPACDRPSGWGNSWWLQIEHVNNLFWGITLQVHLQQRTGTKEMILGIVIWNNCECCKNHWDWNIGILYMMKLSGQILLIFSPNMSGLIWICLSLYLIYFLYDVV